MESLIKNIQFNFTNIVLLALYLEELSEGQELYQRMRQLISIAFHNNNDYIEFFLQIMNGYIGLRIDESDERMMARANDLLHEVLSRDIVFIGTDEHIEKLFYTEKHLEWKLPFQIKLARLFFDRFEMDPKKMNKANRSSYDRYIRSVKENMRSSIVDVSKAYGTGQYEWELERYAESVNRYQKMSEEGFISNNYNGQTSFLDSVWTEQISLMIEDDTERKFVPQALVLKSLMQEYWDSEELHKEDSWKSQLGTKTLIRDRQDFERMYSLYGDTKKEYACIYNEDRYQVHVMYGSLLSLAIMKREYEFVYAVLNDKRRNSEDIYFSINWETILKKTGENINPGHRFGLGYLYCNDDQMPDEIRRILLEVQWNELEKLKAKEPDNSWATYGRIQMVDMEYGWFYAMPEDIDFWRYPQIRYMRDERILKRGMQNLQKIGILDPKFLDLGFAKIPQEHILYNASGFFVEKAIEFMTIFEKNENSFCILFEHFGDTIAHFLRLDTRAWNCDSYLNYLLSKVEDIKKMSLEVQKAFRVHLLFLALIMEQKEMDENIQNRLADIYNRCTPEKIELEKYAKFTNMYFYDCYSEEQLLNKLKDKCAEFGKK